MMEPIYVKIIYIRVCVCNTCGFHLEFYYFGIRFLFYYLFVSVPQSPRLSVSQSLSLLAT